MANAAVTLSNGVVSTITVDGPHEAVEVIQVSGTPVALYFTVGTIASSTPNPTAGTVGAGQGHSYVLPAVLGASRRVERPSQAPRTVVKIVGAGTPVVAVQPIHPVPATE